MKLKAEDLIYKFAKPDQHEYSCPYCSGVLQYLWHGKYLFGLALDKWVWCVQCKKHFKLGTWGFREYELDLPKLSPLTGSEEGGKK